MVLKGQARAGPPDRHQGSLTFTPALTYLHPHPHPNPRPGTLPNLIVRALALIITNRPHSSPSIPNHPWITPSSSPPHPSSSRCITCARSST
eukprot:7382964-Prymnesium_polylepis.3